MLVTVLFFAGLKDQIGRDSLTLELVEEARVSSVIAEFESSLPGFAMAGVRVAVNEEFTSEDLALREGDVLAFIPPVSGG